jgi:hypothetical protein
VSPAQPCQFGKAHPDRTLLQSSEALLIAIAQQAQQIGMRPGFDLQHGLGLQDTKAQGHAREQPGGRSGQDADTDAVSYRGVQGGDTILQRTQAQNGMVPENCALFSQNQPPPFSAKKRDAQQILKFRQCPAQGRLRNALVPRHGRQGANCGNIQKGPDMAQLDRRMHNHRVMPKLPFCIFLSNPSQVHYEWEIW